MIKMSTECSQGGPKVIPKCHKNYRKLIPKSSQRNNGKMAQWKNWTIAQWEHGTMEKCHNCTMAQLQFS